MRPLVLAVAVVQVALPAALLVDRWAAEGSRPVTERPASWQMYSGAPVPTYTGQDASGRARRLDVSDLPPVLRAVGSGRLVPDRLCAADRGLVVVRRDGGPDPGVFRC